MIKLEDIFKKSENFIEKDFVNLSGYPDLQFQKDIYDWALSDVPFNHSYNIVDIGSACSHIYNHAKIVGKKYIGIEPDIELYNEANKLFSENFNDSFTVINAYFERVNDIDFKNSIVLCIGTLNVIVPESDKYTQFKIFLEKINLEDRHFGGMALFIFNVGTESELNTFDISKIFTDVYPNLSNLSFKIEANTLFEGLVKLTIYR